PKEADPPLGMRRDAIIRKGQLEIDVDGSHEIKQRIGELQRKGFDTGLGICGEPCARLLAWSGIVHCSFKAGKLRSLTELLQDALVLLEVVAEMRLHLWRAWIPDGIHALEEFGERLAGWGVVRRFVA